MNTEIIDAGRDMSGGYNVDVSRGTNADRVSSAWFSRPGDERYLSRPETRRPLEGRGFGQPAFAEIVGCGRASRRSRHAGAPKAKTSAAEPAEAS